MGPNPGQNLFGARLGHFGAFSPAIEIDTTGVKHTKKKETAQRGTRKGCISSNEWGTLGGWDEANLNRAVHESNILHHMSLVP